MRKLATVSAVLIGLAAFAPAQKSIDWRTDYATGISQAKSSGKLAMIDFYADW